MCIVTFNKEAIKLTSGIFQQWFINKSPADTKNAGSDDDLLFFVRNSIEKVFHVLYDHVISHIPQGESKVDVARKDSTTLPRYCAYICHHHHSNHKNISASRWFNIRRKASSNHVQIANSFNMTKCLLTLPSILDSYDIVHTVTLL